MDDVKEKFFDEEKQRIALKWFKEKWPEDRHNCEICNTNSWSLAEDVVVAMPLNDKKIVLGGRSYPQIMLVCKNCGNTKYFNAVTMGIITGEKNGN